MRSQTLTLLLVLATLFLVAGDFLPQPWGKVSTQTRTEINQFLISLFPKADLDLEILRRDYQ